MPPCETRRDSSGAVLWRETYTQRGDAQVSWFSAEPACSLELIDTAGADPERPAVDVGAGASRLVDALLGRGFTDVTALDVSVACALSKRRLAGTGQLAGDASASADRQEQCLGRTLDGRAVPGGPPQGGGDQAEATDAFRGSDGGAVQANGSAHTIRSSWMSRCKPSGRRMSWWWMSPSVSAIRPPNPAVRPRGCG